MSRYLALDQSLRTSGYAIFEDNELIKFGTFSTKGTQSVGMRLLSIIDNISRLVEEYNIDYIFIEDIQNQANNLTYARLAYVQGVIFYYCTEKDILYKIMPPSHWRKVLKDKFKINFGRKRAEQKQVAEQFILEHFGEKVSSDEADAICLGYAGLIEEQESAGAF